MIHNFMSLQPTIPGDINVAVSNIEYCVREIDRWMLVSLSEDKEVSAIYHH